MARSAVPRGRACRSVLRAKETSNQNLSCTTSSTGSVATLEPCHEDMCYATLMEQCPGSPAVQERNESSRAFGRFPIDSSRDELGLNREIVPSESTTHGARSQRRQCSMIPTSKIEYFREQLPTSMPCPCYGHFNLHCGYICMMSLTSVNAETTSL
jgi:hypothetical protein